MTPAGAPGRYHAKRVAVIADVHGNAIALAEVLKEVLGAQPELLVFAGDLTWGPLPEETWAVIRHLHQPNAPLNAIWIRGNADRHLLEAARMADKDQLGPREHWMLEAHSGEILNAIDDFIESVVVEVEELGRVRFCHGSPRSDEELITPETPATRMLAMSGAVEERVILSAHTHIQFDREIAGLRSINPGSVGMPYEGKPGAYWALLGPGVDLRCTHYDLDETVRRYQASGDPLAEQLVDTLLEPPVPAQVIAHAETLEFSA